MPAPAIRIEGVGKQYRLGGGVAFEGQVTRRVDAALRAPFRRLLGRPPLDHETEQQRFWALRNVSLEVTKGEVLGLIGANGAGKSTLLKMLARITPPSEGRISLRGQVGSLLEVGTGFHPELTGRENIYLNGSILGMRRQEISARFDEIVEFSGIEKFIETPVKRYSSGMFIRLAFSVAAHLEPEILLIDEVLSVGDAEFQRKCLKKMESIAHADGRTIVFVSHGLPSVRRLCDRVALIEDGRLIEEGPADAIVADYMQRVEPVQHGGVTAIHQLAPRVGTGEARVTRVSLLNDDDEPIEEVNFGQPFTVAMQVEADSDTVSEAAFVVGVSSAEGARILTTSTVDSGGAQTVIPKGESIEVRARMNATLLPGEYVVDVGVVDVSGATLDYLERVTSFSALNVAVDGTEDHYPFETVLGYVRPETQWTLTESAVLDRGQQVAP